MTNLDADMTLSAGERLGRYEILGSLGAGGMGEVYLAKDTDLDREVAIKVLLEAVAQDPDRIARFEREARVLASLSHQNIATLYGIEEHESLRFLVMELAEGETLADRLKKGPLPADDAMEIALQIAKGLEAAHEQGIVHRDLKPANVMLSPEGRVKLLDFGLGKAWQIDDGDSDLTHSPTLTAQMTSGGGPVADQTAWVAELEGRYPQLTGRVLTMKVPGGRDTASFRDPKTAGMIRERVVSLLELSEPGQEPPDSVSSPP